MNLIICYHDPYYDSHGTLNMDYVNKLADMSGSKALCFFDSRSLGSPTIKNPDLLPHVEFLSLVDTTDDIYKIMYDEFSPAVENICLKKIDTYNPSTVLFFNEFYFVKYFRKCPSHKVYFVRSLSQPLLEALEEGFDGSFQAQSALRIEQKRGRAEKAALDFVDHFIVDSHHSQLMLKKHYGHDSTMIRGYINTEPFEKVPTPDFHRKQACYLGRIDWQKGLQRLRPPTKYELQVIGSQILTKGGVTNLGNAKLHGHMTFETYRPIISKVPFFLFPHLWESNGLTVQEAMTMGRIVAVQTHSGGCEESVENGINGFSFDFRNDNDWEQFLDNLQAEYNLRRISEAARSTIPADGYEKSLEKLAQTIVCPRYQ